MVKKRRLQRIKEVAQEVENSIHAKAEEEKIQYVESTSLFQIDTCGQSKNKRVKEPKDPSIWSKKFISKKSSLHEKSLIEKAKKNITKKSSTSGTSSSNTSLTNLWGSDGNLVQKKPIKNVNDFTSVAEVRVSALKRVPSTKYKVDKVEVADPGQSYHPEFNAHQDTIGEAVALEVEKYESRQEARAPLLTGMKEETKQYINEEEFDSDADSNEEDSSNDCSNGVSRKLKDKKTRADRNKLARHKALVAHEKEMKQEKKFLKSINRAETISYELKKDDLMKKKRREELQMKRMKHFEEGPMIKVAGKKVKVVRPIDVALSDELTGNLRAMQQKGNALLDRYDSLRKRNMIDIGGHARVKSKKRFKVITT